MKISANFSVETPIFVYAYSIGMRREQFYADSVKTAKVKLELSGIEFDIVNIIDARV